MSRKLPTSITPVPIVQAIAEVRFETAMPPDAMLGVLYPSFKDTYRETRQLDILNLPLQMREQNPDLKFAPTHQMLGGKYIIQVGPRVFSVVANGDYAGWTEFRNTISNAYQIVLKTGIITRMVRCSMRYIDFFENDIFPNLNLSIQLDGVSAAGPETVFRTIDRTRSFWTVLQINNTSARNVSGAVTKGSSIDIDVQTVLGANPNPEDALKLLEPMHTCGNEIFFKLLKDSFLETLKPQY